MQTTSKPVQAGLAEARRSRSADPSRFDDELDDAGDEWQPLSPEEAAVWRARQPKAVVWRLLGWQSFAVIAGAVLIWVLDAFGLFKRVSDFNLAASFAYGGGAVVVPAVLMAVGLQGRFTRRLSTTPTGALLGFAIWEGFKVLASVILLFTAPHFVVGLSWFALLAGLLVALKVHWLVLGLSQWRARRSV